MMSAAGPALACLNAAPAHSGIPLGSSMAAAYSTMGVVIWFTSG